MFLENERKLCECKANLFFLADKVTQTCLVLYTDYHYPYDFMSGNVGTWDFYISIAMFCDYCFLSIFDASINFMRCFPLIIKNKERKKKPKKKTKTLNPWIDLVNLKVLFLRNSKELDFLCDCSNGVCLPNVLKNMFIMLFP